jgi:hypothetical protein
MQPEITDQFAGITQTDGALAPSIRGVERDPLRRLDKVTRVFERCRMPPLIATDGGIGSVAVESPGILGLQWVKREPCCVQSHAINRNGSQNDSKVRDT